MQRGFMSPENTLESLKSSASNRVKRTLDSVYVLCVEQVDRGNADFSFSTLARLGVDRGVPAAQSIRNKSGLKYRILISSFSAAYPHKIRSRQYASGNDWINDIADPKAKFLTTMLFSELTEAKRLIREIVPPGLEIIVDDRKGLSGEYRLNPLERRAIEFLMTTEFFELWGVALGKFGDVTDKNGRKLFKPGTIDAFEKALKYL
jgi:hypothetical protein